MFRRPPPDTSHLYSVRVDNISYRMSADDLRRSFEKHGEVGDVYIPRDPFSMESKGFGFIRYAFFVFLIHSASLTLSYGIIPSFDSFYVAEYFDIKCQCLFKETPAFDSENCVFSLKKNPSFTRQVLDSQVLLAKGCRGGHQADGWDANERTHASVFHRICTSGLGRRLCLGQDQCTRSHLALTISLPIAFAHSLLHSLPFTFTVSAHLPFSICGSFFPHFFFFISHFWFLTHELTI